MKTGTEEISCWSCDRRIPRSGAAEIPMDDRQSMFFCGDDCENEFLKFWFAESGF